MKEEIWKTIPGYERYEASNLGNVRSLKKTLNPASVNGYMIVRISDRDGKYKTKLIHRLVMESFVGGSLLVVDHIDGNRSNNHLENLEYVSQRENILRKKTSKGFRFIEATGKWVGRILSDGKRIHLGTFNTKQEALDAYNKAKLTAINKNSKGQHI